MEKKVRSFLATVRGYGRSSLLVRGILITSLVIILVLAAVFTMTYSMSRGMVEDSVLEMNRVITERAMDDINAVLDESALVGAEIALGADVRSFILEGRSDDALVRRLGEECTSYAQIFDAIQSVYIYRAESDSLVSNVYNGAASQYADKSWRDGYDLIREDRVYAVSRVHDSGYPFFLTVIIPYFFYQGEASGAVMVNLDMDRLDDLLLGISNSAEQRVAITDGGGRVLYASDRALYGGLVDADPLLARASVISGSEIYTDEAGGRFILSSASLDNRGWRYLAWLPLDTYDDSFDSLSSSMWRMVGVVAVLGILGALLLAVRAYLPVRGILASLEQSSDGALPTREENTSETDYISRMIAASAQKSKSMSLELEKRVRLMHEAQASALQAQITPHFLANTLDAIRWGAIELGNGENEVSQMITVLSALLRTSLDMESALVPVSAEIEHCKLYLTIMSYRYSTELSVTWEIPEEIKSLPIAKLSFQPILENAIYHGLKPVKMSGRILIQAVRDGDRALIRFSDNGVGIREEDLDRLNRELGSKTALLGSHIGMHNVNQRLKLLFGLEYGVRIASVQGFGTIIELVIPAGET